MYAVTCPACGSAQDVYADVGAFRCKSCQRDVWRVECRRCHSIALFFGSATGAGALEFPCTKCRRRTLIAKSVLRASLAEARRVERAAHAEARQAAAQAREARVLHAQTRAEQVDEMNRHLQARLQAIATTLAGGVRGSGDGFTFASMKAPLSLPRRPEPPQLPEEPNLGAFMPPPLKGVPALLPTAKRKYAAAVQLGQAAFHDALEAHAAALAQLQAEFEAATKVFEAEVARRTETVERQRQYVDQLQERVEHGDPQAITELACAALSSMRLPYDPPAEPRVAFSRESSQLLVELVLPSLEVVPAIRQYRYLSTRDEVVEVPLPRSERGSLYTSLVAQVTLLAISTLFRMDAATVVETVVVNGTVRTTDARTGQEIQPCLVTVRATRDHFGAINLGRVDPIACLKSLNAAVSRSPAELVPVRPLLEFDMADPRFVKETDVLSGLDSRPNLMELTPSEFESLITNLFEQMGLETRLTQPSRDGGVDCVAYDLRPIFGGKVVIQAKRYRDTVGVAAVRDLFGTVVNEGAGKGILVTTSGFGQASHDFANGKPLELIDGANLLYLLHEHAGVEAKIEPPDDWEDPPEPH